MKARAVRWTAAFVVVTAAAVICVVSSLGGFATCRDIASQVGTNPVAEVCEPVSWQTVIPLVLVSLLLLLPDISELSVGGLSIKRLLAEESQAREDLESRIRPLIADQIKEHLDPEKIGAKTAQFTSGGDAGEDPVSASPEQVGLLVTGWGMLEPYLELARLARRQPDFYSQASAYFDDPTYLIPESYRRVLDRLPRPLSADEMRTVVRWERVFMDELRYARSIRNDVAHGKPTDEHLVASAVEAVDRLRSLLP